MGLCDCGEILDTSYGGCKEKLEKIKRLGEGGKRNVYNSATGKMIIE